MVSIEADKVYDILRLKSKGKVDFKLLNHWLADLQDSIKRYETEPEEKQEVA